MSEPARTSRKNLPSADGIAADIGSTRPHSETSRTARSILTSVAVEQIDVPTGRRKIDPNWVEVLAQDIAQRGQQVPIEVIQVLDRYRLVAGAHRLAALKACGAASIRATVHEAEAFASEAEIRLREIAENLLRRELSVLDRAVDVAAWREIFEAAQGAVRRGGDRRSKSKSQVATLIGEKKSQPETVSDLMLAASDRFAANFTEAAQQALGLSRDAIYRALKIATISADVRELIALHPIADNQSELLALAASDEQLRIATLIVTLAATNVADAQAQILGVVPAQRPEAWARLADSFARLKTRDQERFFELHRAAIVIWLEQSDAE